MVFRFGHATKIWVVFFAGKKAPAAMTTAHAQKLDNSSKTHKKHDFSIWMSTKIQDRLWGRGNTKKHACGNDHLTLKTTLQFI